MRSLASGKNGTTFTVASNEFIGGGKEKSEYHPVVAWDRLAEIAGRYLGKGQQVAIEGRLQTRSWDDDKGAYYCYVKPTLEQRCQRTRISGSRASTNRLARCRTKCRRRPCGPWPLGTATTT